jgi:hypothetical protein
MRDYRSMKPVSRFCCLLLLLSTACVVGFARPALDRDWIILSGGTSGLFDTEHNPSFTLEYRFEKNWKGLHPWLGLGWATDGAVFAGGGAVYSISTPKDTWALTGGVGLGYYERHQGADLGSHLEICTFIEVSRNLPSQHRVMIRFMHISNGGLTEKNPGNELLLLGYAMPLP